MSDRQESVSQKPSDLLSPGEAAQILRVTARTVQRYINAGDLPAVRLPGGRLWRIRRSDVEALLTQEASA